MNTSSQDIPLYQLVEEESGEIYIEASDLQGFFVEADWQESDDIRIFGVARESLVEGRDISDVELRVLDSNRKTIGSYYIGPIRLRASVGCGGENDWGGFVVSFYGSVCPYAEAGTIWRRWATGAPIESGEWLNYPVGSHASWLHVVQNAWFEAGRDAKRYGTDDVIVLNGDQIFGESSFYCALGESINGPGGYFGSNLDALDDCLVSSGADGYPSRLLWKDYSIVRERMGSSEAESAMEILREFGIEVILQ